MNTATSASLPKDKLVHAVDRAVVSLTPSGDEHTLIAFLGADGKTRIASARNERELPAVGSTARFHAYENPNGTVQWRFAFASSTTIESASDAAQA